MAQSSKLEIIAGFNKLQWHDSKLVGVSIERTAPEQDDILCSVVLHYGRAMKPTAVVFKNCQFASLNLDLFGKRLCADDIWTGECVEDSEFLKEIEAQRQTNKMYPLRAGVHSLAGYLHFRLIMIPPGGTLDIIAETFEIEGDLR